MIEIKVTFKEGGRWIAFWIPGQILRFPKVPCEDNVFHIRGAIDPYDLIDDFFIHSIRFPDGQEFDAQNGWRPSPGEMINIRRKAWGG